MGCTSSVCASAIARRKKKKKKKKNIQLVTIFFPSLRIPVQCDIQKSLRGLIPTDILQRISSLRNQIALVAEDTGGSAISELQNVLEEYVPLLLGLTNKDHGLERAVEFRWKVLGNGREQMCVANSWFELLCILHMMSVLTLMEANLKLIPKDNIVLSERLVPADSMSDAVDLLLKAVGYLNLCIHDVFPQIPIDIKNKMPIDMQQNVLEAISHQALSQGTELQLGLAVQSQNVSWSVRRRLACEQLSFLGKALHCLSKIHNVVDKKQITFLKWKYLEAKAAAYYHHGFIIDKGTEPSAHVSAVCCFLGAEEFLAESRKACLTFCLAHPVTRASPPWGAMKHLHKKIPETASKKSQMYGYLLDQDKELQILPDLPEFQLSLKPDDYELPKIDSAWDCGNWEIPGQTLKQHLNDDDELET